MIFKSDAKTMEIAMLLRPSFDECNVFSISVYVPYMVKTSNRQIQVNITIFIQYIKLIIISSLYGYDFFFVRGKRNCSHFRNGPDVFF